MRDVFLVRLHFIVSLYKVTLRQYITHHKHGVCNFSIRGSAVSNVENLRKCRQSLHLHFSKQNCTFWEFVEYPNCNVYRTVGQFSTFGALRPRNAELHTDLQAREPEDMCRPGGKCRAVRCLQIHVCLLSLVHTWHCILEPSHCSFHYYHF
jgi:hypothetical protein